MFQVVCVFLTSFYFVSSTTIINILFSLLSIILCSLTFTPFPLPLLFLFPSLPSGESNSDELHTSVS